MILKKGSLKKLPALLKVTFFNTLHTLPITVACMAVATLTANAIFHLSGNAINVSIIYILAILLHARYTKCYSAGIIASLYSVFWVNYAYTYPYMTLNLSLIHILHHDPVMCAGNVMTEYEEKFSSMGNPICKLIAMREPKENKEK